MMKWASSKAACIDGFDLDDTTPKARAARAMTGPIPARWAPYLLSVLRIAAAFSFMTHGTQKLFAVPVNELRAPVPLASLVGLAGVLETFRSEEHTSELQSHVNLVCRLLLEKKKYKQIMLSFTIKTYKKHNKS